VNYKKMDHRQLTHEYKKRLKALLLEKDWNRLKHCQFTKEFLLTALERDDIIIRAHAGQWQMKKQQ
jgi:hypothetical protein